MSDASESEQEFGESRESISTDRRPVPDGGRRNNQPQGGQPQGGRGGQPQGGQPQGGRGGQPQGGRGGQPRGGQPQGGQPQGGQPRGGGGQPPGGSGGESLGGDDSSISRRNLLIGGAGVAGVAAVGGAGYWFLFRDSGVAGDGADWLPAPDQLAVDDGLALATASDVEDDYPDTSASVLDDVDSALDAIANSYEGSRLKADVTSPTAIRDHREDIGFDNWDSYVDTHLNLDFAVPIPDEVDLKVDVSLGTVTVDIDVDGFSEISEVRVHDSDTSVLTAFEGDFNEERIQERIENQTDADDSSIYSETTGANDLTYYTHTDTAEAYAFSDDLYIEAEPPGSPNIPSSFADDNYNPDAVDLVDMIDTFVDAHEGDIDRYEDVDEEFDDLLSAAPSGEETFLSMLYPDRYDHGAGPDPEDGEFEGHIGTAVTVDIDGSESEYTYTLLFESDGDASEPDVQDWVDESVFFNGFRAVDVEEDGQTIDIVGTLPSREF